MKTYLIIIFCLLLNAAQGQGKFFGGSEDGFATSQATVFLPVHLVSYDVTIRNDHAQITWKAITTDVPFFVLELSTDGIQFSRLAEKKAINNSYTAAQYVYDDIARSGKWYYRLKWTELSGQQLYSKIIAISFPGKENVRVYYDGAADYIHIIKPSADPFIAIYNSDGKLFKRVINNTADCMVSIAGLPAGAYIVKTYGSRTGGISTTRFVKPGN